MDDRQYRGYLDNLVQQISSVKPPLTDRHHVKWCEQRAWENTEQCYIGMMNGYTHPENVGVMDRTQLGIWVEYNTRIAESGTPISSSVVQDADAVTKMYPYKTFAVRGRPEDIPRMIEIIESGKLPEKSEGSPALCVWEIV